MPEHPNTIRIAGAAHLGLGQTRVFPLPRSEEQGFVIGSEEGLRAYRNRCRHWPAPLDMEDGEFWSPDFMAIQCKIHGATYRAEDGFCTMGPCSGASLESWPVEIDGDDVLVRLG